jgi:ribonuclease VapC
VTVVLDASALLAFLRDEPGADVVAEVLDVWIVSGGPPAAIVSTVNWVEVAERVADPRVLDDLASTVGLVPLDRLVAEAAGGLRAVTRPLGLSLADRVCLALGKARGVPVLTADTAWGDADVGVEVRLIR